MKQKPLQWCSSRQIFALLFGDVVMDVPSAHHAVSAPVSERYVCCFVLFSFLLCRFVSGPCLHTPVWRRQFFFAVNSVSSFLFNSIQFRFLNFFQFSVSCSLTHNDADPPYRLVESGLTTYCPCQLETGAVSSRQIHMSIVYNPLFASSLIIVPVWILSFSTTTFPARTIFCIENERFTNSHLRMLCTFDFLHLS